MDGKEKNIFENINQFEEKLSYLLNKIFKYRNENVALQKRLEILEEENSRLRLKRDNTLLKLKNILEKMDNADF